MLDLLPRDTSKLLGVGAAGLISWYIISSILTWHKLRHIPGPFLAKFSYLWLVKNSLLGRQAEAFLDLKKYGSIVRTGPNYLSTDDPNLLRYIGGLRSNYPRDGWYAGARTDLKSEAMGNMTDTAAHDKFKARVVNGYNGRDQVNLEAIVGAQITRFCNVIRQRYLSTSSHPARSVDFSLISRYFTLDVITALGYGKPLGFLDAEKDLYGYTESLAGLAEIFPLFLDVPWLRRLRSSRLTNGITPKPTDDWGMGKVLGVVHQEIHRRFDNDQKDHKDMVGSFMRHGLTREQTIAESIIQLSAGSDTSASVIRATMLYISATPRVCGIDLDARLKSEAKEATRAGNISLPITLAEAKTLPYLQAVIWEGFRMRPAVVYGHFKVVPPQGDTINGVHLPGGAAIGHNPYAMMRRSDIFGDDVDVFRPERFLECDEAKRQEMERTIDVVFGVGRWTCAGKAVAWMELNKIFFEVIYPGKAWREPSYILFEHRDMWMRITEAE